MFTQISIDTNKVPQPHICTVTIFANSSSYVIHYMSHFFLHQLPSHFCRKIKTKCPITWTRTRNVNVTTPQQHSKELAPCSQGMAMRTHPWVLFDTHSTPVDVFGEALSGPQSDTNTKTRTKNAGGAWLQAQVAAQVASVSAGLDCQHRFHLHAILDQIGWNQLTLYHLRFTFCTLHIARNALRIRTRVAVWTVPSIHVHTHGHIATGKHEHTYTLTILQAWTQHPNSLQHDTQHKNRTSCPSTPPRVRRPQSPGVPQSVSVTEMEDVMVSKSSSWNVSFTLSRCPSSTFGEKTVF